MTITQLHNTIITVYCKYSEKSCNLFDKWLAQISKKENQSFENDSEGLLKVVETLPRFIVSDLSGKLIGIRELVANKKTLLIF